MYYTPEQIVENQLEHYNKHNLDDFCSVFSDQVEVYNFGETVPYITGIDAFKKRYVERFKNDKLHVTIDKRMILGNTVIDYEIVKESDTGEPRKVIAIYIIENSKIAKVWFIRK